MAQIRPRKRGAESTSGAITVLPFEAAFAQMQDVIVQLERGDLPLEEAILAFERGMALAQRCNGLLENAQQRVQELEGDEADSFVLHDIAVDS